MSPTSAATPCAQACSNSADSELMVGCAVCAVDLDAAICWKPPALSEKECDGDAFVGLLAIWSRNCAYALRGCFSIAVVSSIGYASVMVANLSIPCENELGLGSLACELLMGRFADAFEGEKKELNPEMCVESVG